MIRQLRERVGRGHEVIAEFWFQDGTLQKRYRSRRIQRLIEQDGATTADGTFYPKDGKPFWVALATAFNRSTLFSVRDVDLAARQLTREVHDGDA